MWHTLEDWQLTQLRKLASLDQERAETVLNTVWSSYPGLFEQVALSAVDQNELSIERCAELLDMDKDEIVYRLAQFRRAAVHLSSVAIVHEDGKDAKIASGNVSVWEVVREYRKIGSVDRLVEAFPSLSTSELAAALKYAAQHPEEIEEQIGRYEETLARRRNEYPFSKLG